MIKKTYRVPDMHCTNCAMRLEGLEDHLPGLKHVRVSYRKQQMDIEYDETLVDATRIIDAIRRLGYTAIEK